MYSICEKSLSRSLKYAFLTAYYTSIKSFLNKGKLPLMKSRKCFGKPKLLSRLAVLLFLSCCKRFPPPRHPERRLLIWKQMGIRFTGYLPALDSTMVGNGPQASPPPEAFGSIFQASFLLILQRLYNARHSASLSHPLLEGGDYDTVKAAWWRPSPWQTQACCQKRQMLRKHWWTLPLASFNRLSPRSSSPPSLPLSGCIP